MTIKIRSLFEAGVPTGIAAVGAALAVLSAPPNKPKL